MVSFTVKPLRDKEEAAVMIKPAGIVIQAVNF